MLQKYVNEFQRCIIIRRNCLAMSKKRWELDVRYREDVDFFCIVTGFVQGTPLKALLLLQRSKETS